MKEPIAIIGMGCRYPGGVDDAESFWQLLVNQVDAVGPMPPDRFDPEHYYDPTPSTPGKVVTREGGFLDDITHFDADFFGISAYEATLMDPQQRLLLQVTWEAIEEAGIVRSHLNEIRTGVFVGIWTNDYENLVYGASDNIDLYATTGVGRYTASGRLSYLFDFRGPSLTLDTACSSSLVAVHLACQSLWNNESQLAIAGGANLIITPQISIGYSRSGMLSPDARCKFGDASANGYVRSEGVGVLILKRLSDALADGDPIRAVIRGSAVNNDGQTGGSLVAPGVSGQIEMLRAAYRSAGINPGDVGYIEAHGTGTRVGDPIELKALGAVLSKGRAPNTPCWIGSVKTNIGHTEAASGMAGLIKAALALEHGEIPASLHFHEPNPNIPWSSLPFQIATQRVPWPSSDAPRYAGVNSFGVTGTNAHIVLEEAPAIDKQRHEAHQTPDYLILPLSAHKPEALNELIARYSQFITDNSSAINNILYTAAAHRTHHVYRAAFTGKSAQELSEQLSNWNTMPHESSPRKIAFVFPGQGGQWLGMGRQLMEAEPVFREMILRCEKAMQPYIDFSLVWVLTSAEAETAFEDIGMVQPAIFAIQVALAELWRAKGITPDAVIGHSMGEAAAAYTAGALSLEDAAAVICLRSQLMRRVSGMGGMALAELSLQEAQALLTGYEGQLSVAVNNAPRSVVISGDAEALERVLTQLQSRDVFCRRVKVDVAAHSPHMDALRPELVNALAGIAPRNATVDLYSTVTGSILAGQDFDAEYWGHNLREPVRFSDAVQQALRDGCNTFIELGPHPVLLPAIERGLSDYQLEQTPIDAVALIESMRRDEDQMQVMAEALARLYSAGYELDWTRFYPTGQIVHLPRFPWQGKRYWVDVDPTALIAKAARTPSENETWRDWLYEPRWEAVDSPAAQTSQSGRWLIFADEAGLGETLSRQLANAGHSTRLVRRGPNYGVDGSEVTINPAQISDFQHLLADSAGQFTGIVYLWGAYIPAGMGMSVQELADAQAETLGGLLHLTQALVENRQSLPIWIVTRGAQGAGQQDHSLSPAQGTLWGFGRVIREEHPDLWGGLIDLDPQAADDLVETLWNAISAQDGEDQVAYRSGQRYALRLVQADLPRETNAYRFRKDGTYLITGGLGDIGSVLAKWMLEQGARRFILMGRTQLPPRAQWRNIPAESDLGRKIAIVLELEALGASVHVAPVDVANEAELRAYLDTFEGEGWPPIVGVIHAAGVLDVRLIQQLDWEAMMRVLRPKLVGGWLLHTLLPSVELFVNFSSINALLGLPGQGNYAAANTFLDSLAAYHQTQGRRTLSINWGVWQGMGYASTQTGADSSEQLAAQGIGGFSAEAGARVFINVLNWNHPQLVVVPADWKLYQSERSRSRQFPMLKSLLDEERVEQRTPQATSVVAQLWAVDSKNRLNALGDQLQELVSQILRIPAARIKRDEPLGSYGINSLMGMELRNRLERDLGLTLSATLVWNYPTIELMGAFLAERLGLVDRTTSETPAEHDSQPNEAPALSSIIADVDTLSDDDILKELMGKS